MLFCEPFELEERWLTLRTGMKQTPSCHKQGSINMKAIFKSKNVGDLRIRLHYTQLSRAALPCQREAGVSKFDGFVGLPILRVSEWKHLEAQHAAYDTTGKCFGQNLLVSRHSRNYLTHADSSPGCFGDHQVGASCR
ncbi:hypothetical protein F1559_001047 [Cyanidiococcus yangmingshanensis]|uniref:Uncharacterized protein n=1 Tax=Cyanidiococcus yangmingshanensis TaxID=2690220 RepID=A0A7J7IJF0_9RHOD|nr:hypothetical protein F1559_001047 [Cyanidiococcus yangmingshanensis]